MTSVGDRNDAFSAYLAAKLLWKSPEPINKKRAIELLEQASSITSKMSNDKLEHQRFARVSVEYELISRRLLLVLSALQNFYYNGQSVDSALLRELLRLDIARTEDAEQTKNISYHSDDDIIVLWESLGTQLLALRQCRRIDAHDWKSVYRFAKTIEALSDLELEVPAAREPIATFVLKHAGLFGDAINAVPLRTGSSSDTPVLTETTVTAQCRCSPDAMAVSASASASAASTSGSPPISASAVESLHSVVLTASSDVETQSRAVSSSVWLRSLPLNLALDELHKLFEKKRSQVVSIWTVESAASAFDSLLRRRLSKYDQMREKVMLYYCSLLLRCGPSSSMRRAEQLMRAYVSCNNCCAEIIMLSEAAVTVVLQLIDSEFSTACTEMSSSKVDGLLQKMLHISLRTRAQGLSFSSMNGLTQLSTAMSCARERELLTGSRADVLKAFVSAIFSCDVRGITVFHKTAYDKAAPLMSKLVAKWPSEHDPFHAKSSASVTGKRKADVFESSEAAPAPSSTPAVSVSDEATALVDSGYSEPIVEHEVFL